MQIINGKYVEGFYIYARQLPNPAANNAMPTTPNSNPLLASPGAALASSSSSSASATASASALISTKPNIAAAGKRDAMVSTGSSSSSSALQQEKYSTKYRMLTILNGGGASSCTLTGLLQYTLYEFFIVPFYKSVEGKPSNSRLARTLEDGK